MNTKFPAAKIISWVIIGMLVIAALLWFIPHSTRVDHTLRFSKFDHHGNELGTTEIRIAGRKLDYLFQKSRADFTITPFDGLAWIKPAMYGNTGTEGRIATAMENGILYTHYYGCLEDASGQGDDMTHFTLGFSPDMDRWIIKNDSDKVYYVASVNGMYSTQELVEYFRILIPANWTTDTDTPVSTINQSLHQPRWYSAGSAPRCGLFRQRHPAHRI